jgi:predicted acylesterase/phospholipase RssA
MHNQGRQPLFLAFSGGGAKCAAEAGVLQVMAEAGLPVGGLSGVSGGGLVAVLAGLGLAPEAISDYIAETQLLGVWEPDPTHRAIFGDGRMHARLRTLLDDRTFADLHFPVRLGTVELSTGREVWLDSGALEPAVLATMALPGLFLPQEINGRVLTDGGLVAPLPVAAAAGLGRPVIAVDLLSGGVTAANPPQLFEARGPLRYAAVIGKRLGLLAMLEAVHQASLVLNVKLLEAQLAACPAEVVIVPEVTAVGLFAFDLAPLAYTAGVAAAEAVLPKLEALAEGQLSPA